MSHKVIAIVPSSGLGRRFGSDANKPFQILGGKPLVVWALEALESVDAIEEIIPVLRKEDVERGIEVFRSYNISKTKRVAAGGKERQDSVYNGLKLIGDKNCIVLIHDGVRPFIEKDLIEKVIKELLKGGKGGLKSFDGVVLGVPVKDTIKEAGSGIIRRTIKRDSLWAIQTPQVFPYKKISAAYKKSIKEGFYSTDDAALMERYGGKIKVIMGSYSNIKITTPDDLIFAEYLLSKKVNFE
ncbi:MAG TPA: 2-C-methyl-D-erythritol 4-phosphate cytidylyltransferase [Thermodesulfovibrionales bacterium]|nr:2-C-methyl-D-erythritol 4-phosphate cytidylyltransferase [Thermodesulfovibrionales bacterium]